MANRRMFNIALISADEFFELENSAKILYFYLALTADDDGFINGLNRIQRSLGCSDADLEALISIGYIIRFPSGKAVIRHWRVHNYIRTDIYAPTQCTQEKAMLSLNGGKVYYLKDDKVEAEKYRDADVDETLTQDRVENKELKKENQKKPSAETKDTMEVLNESDI